jgi:RNA polymerase sigma-70 factor, ECF subfamily
VDGWTEPPAERSPVRKETGRAALCFRARAAGAQIRKVIVSMALSWSRTKMKAFPADSGLNVGMGIAQARFEALVGAYSAHLYRFAYWLCRDRERARDLVQETYLRAWRSLSSLRDEKVARYWLFTILRREHARGYERYQPPLADVEPDDLAGDTASPSMEVLLLRRELARLSEEYREPLMMQVLGGFSCEEIAEAMGLSKAAVTTRLFRARQKLRSALEGDEDGTVNRELNV